MNFKKGFKDITVWLLLSIVMGVLGGTVGAAFWFCLDKVTNVRQDNARLIFLLPAAGVVSVAVSKGLKADGIGTVSVFERARGDRQKLPFGLSVAVFIGTVLTHLCGGSAGKEGAALQIGGGLSAIVCKVFKLSQKSQKTLVLCAMAALFSAVFGTPLTATVFALEALRLKKERFWEILPCLISSLVGFLVANILGVEPERFSIAMNENISVWLVAALLCAAVAASFAGELFCYSLRFVRNKAKRFLKNDYLRILIGGLLVILITLIIGDYRYNGSSSDVLHNIFSHGEVKYQDFALKFLLTVITVSFGFKGGQIVPSLFIGAALGGAVALVFGVSVPIAAAVGLAAAFCAVTNCTMASILLSFELFSGEAIIYLGLAVIISRLISGKINLYGDTPPILKKRNAN